MPTLIIVVVLLLIAWIFFVLPTRRRQRSHQAMQESVTVAYEIITSGGSHGFVREDDGMEVRLEIAEGVVVRLDRRAIAAVAEDVPAGDEEDETDEDPEPDQEDQAEESLKG